MTVFQMKTYSATASFIGLYRISREVSTNDVTDPVFAYTNNMKIGERYKEPGRLTSSFAHHLAVEDGLRSESCLQKG